MSHTPGPWRVYELLGNTYIVAGRKEAPTSVARVFWNEYSYVKNANARLIAAAPDLLAALERVMFYVGCYCPDISEEASSQAHVAIKKARGE